MEYNLETVAIELSSRCNYACVGCPNESLPRGKGDMDPLLFSNIFREVGDSLKKVMLWNYGEPLLNPNAVEMLGGVRDYKCQKVLSTNGSKLGDFPDLSFLSCLDELIISVNGLTSETYQVHQRGGDFAKVMDGIRRVVPVLDGSKTRLIFQLVAHNGNLHQIDQVGDFARDLGFQEAVVKSYNVMDMSMDTFDRFVPLGTPYSRYDKRDLQIGNLKPAKAYPCTKGLIVNWDGSVNPCCWDYKGEHYLGNVKDDGVYAVWNSGRAREWRDRVFFGQFPEICVAGCIFSKSVRRWNFTEGQDGTRSI